MEYYYFAGGDHTEGQKIEYLENLGFSGVLFTYEPGNYDYFTKIARTLKINKQFKYLVAIRPYLISPQYLRKISETINGLSKNRLQINLISGHIKEQEKEFGGIVGEINDNSYNKKRSNYLIDFLEEDYKMSQKKSNFPPSDIFVTTTNKYVFTAASQFGYKVIVPYYVFKDRYWSEYRKDQENNIIKIKGDSVDFNNSKTMLVMNPVIRENELELAKCNREIFNWNAEFYTYETLYLIIQNLKSSGIGYLMFAEVYNEEKNIMQFMKWLKEREKIE